MEELFCQIFLEHYLELPASLSQGWIRLKAKIPKKLMHMVDEYKMFILQKVKEEEEHVQGKMKASSTTTVNHYGTVI